MFIGMGGRQVFMVDLGAGGLPFVAHSGWIGTWEDWEPQLAALSRTRRAIGFDHRGAGRTGGEPEHVTFSALVDDLVALLDGLGITRCALGGFSNGNRVVQEAVARQPDRYAGLVLMCPSERPEANEGFIGLLQADYNAGIEAFLDRCLPEPDSGHVRRWARDVLHQSSAEQAVALLRALSGPSVATERPGALTLPTLVVQGDADPLSPVAYGEVLVAAIAGAKHVVVPGGHLIAQTRPDATSAPMADFLATLD
jgi:pimeloyl-ACP methyl ester carboxylesterase